MDAELVAVASTAAATLVTLLTTDAWEGVKVLVGAWWRRVEPGRAAAVETDLVAARRRLLACRAPGAEQVEQVESELAAEWQARLLRLLAVDPDLATELRRLGSAPDDSTQPVRHVWTGAVRMQAATRDHGRVYQVGQGEQRISES